MEYSLQGRAPMKTWRVANGYGETRYKKLPTSGKRELLSPSSSLNPFVAIFDLIQRFG
jgi:hypothetical protein